MRPIPLPLALVCLLLPLPGLCRAASAPPSDLFQEWLSGWAPVSPGAAMVYGLDPETGAWGHPGRSAATLFVSMVEGEDRSVLVRMADGSTVVYPDPRLFSDFIVARVGRDGALYFECSDPAAAARLVSRPVGAPPER